MLKIARTDHPFGMWSTKLAGVNHAVLPSHTPRPNPVVTGNRVIASIFSPGTVCALSKQEGRLLWRTELDSYGGSACVPHGRKVYATSCRSLYALNPRSGDILWKFTPYTDPGEWIYSQPALSKERVFIGDRRGYLHCLDTVTGKHLWRRRISRACNNQANATALVVNSQVVAANNDGAVVCYHANSGETIWRRRVDGPVIAGLLRYESHLLVASTSFYRIDLATGAVHQKMSFPGKSVDSLSIAQRCIIVHLGPDLKDRDVPWNSELAVIEKDRVIARRPSTAVTHLGSFDGFACSADHLSFKILDPHNGKVLASKRRAMAIPDVMAGRMYGLTRQGVVFSDPMPVL